MTDRQVNVGDALVVMDGQMWFADSQTVATVPVETQGEVSSADTSLTSKWQLPRAGVTYTQRKDEVVGLILKSGDKLTPLVELEGVVFVVKRVPLYAQRGRTTTFQIETGTASKNNPSLEDAARTALDRSAVRNERIHQERANAALRARIAQAVQKAASRRLM
jgi:hypothetical protein